jgi:uncharacterized protein YkwD
MFFYLFACQPNNVDFPQHSHQTSMTPWGVTSVDPEFIFSDEELHLMEEINGIRNELGLQELEAEIMIGSLARAHSENMANGEIDLGHQGFQSRIASLYGNLEVVSAAENVALGQDIEGVINQWLDSQGHADNILGDYNLSGTGIVIDDNEQLFFTQIFVLGESLN